MRCQVHVKDEDGVWQEAVLTDGGPRGRDALSVVMADGRRVPLGGGLSVRLPDLERHQASSGVHSLLRRAREVIKAERSA